jgi:hypothetical protein
MRKQRPWTQADNDTLKSLAGKVDSSKIAEQLGRSLAATVVQASKLRISLRTRTSTRFPERDAVDRNQPAD